MFIEEDKTTFNDNFKFTIIVWIEQKTNNAKIVVVVVVVANLLFLLDFNNVDNH